MLKPVRDVIVCREIPKEESLIHVPDNVKTERDPEMIFEVLASGPGRHYDGVFIPGSDFCSVGDRVLLEQYGKVALKHNGDKVVLSRHQSVICIVEDE